jgi:nucleoid-associated protein YgaU
MSRLIRLAVILALSVVLVNCPSTPKPPQNTAAAPAFTPAEGVFTKAQSVTLASSTEGAEIRFTTDGSVPSSTTGTLYSSPINVSATTTIRAIASKTGFLDSPVVSATFTITGAVAAIQMSPAEGTFDTSVAVALSTATDGAQIYFTTDGSNPTPSSGTLYAGPISVTATETIKAVGVKKDWDSSAISSALYTIRVVVQTPVTPPVAAITDVEVTDARNAIARAKEVDADYYDPDNYDQARRLLGEGLDLRVTDPATARERLASSKEKADLAFTNAVQRAAADLAARMEAARKSLLALAADKFMPVDFQNATSGISEAADLYGNNDFAGARTRAYKALKDMAELRNRLEGRIQTVRGLKYDTEQLMKQAENGELYQWAPGQKDKVTGLYLQGIDAYQGYRLDDAEESFGAAREAARDTLRIAKEAQDTRQAEAKKKADAAQAQVMKSLQDASKLTVVTEDGTVVKPQNWTEEDFLKEIDQMLQQEQQNQKQNQQGSGGHSMHIPTDGSTAVMADDSTASLLQQARDLWTQGLKEKAAGNYDKALDYFNEAQRYIDIYKSFAVKGVYTVRLVPDRRDCLWRIAEYKDIYGDPFKWPNIWRRNRKLIQNPDLIYPGWQLVIPPD